MSKAKKVYNWFGSKSAILALAILLVFSSIAFSNRNFLSWSSLMNVARKAASDGGFLALGMTFVILIGQIDLSVGAVLALAGVITGMVSASVNPILGILAGLGVGLLCGFVNGLMVAKMRISSWIATLAMMLGVRGIVLLISNQKPVSISSPLLQALGNTTIFGFHILVLFLIGLTLICMYVSRNTRFGMGLYAVGGNEEAAKMMGLKVDRIKIAAYTCCGLFAAIAGILLAGRLYTAQPNAGDSWETTAIAMCALGGVKLSGGEGKFSGTFFGVLMIAVINTIFNYAGNLNSAWQNVVMGVLVLISIGVQSEIFHTHRNKKKEAKESVSAC
jgi:ribose/xylose/arabinose/galactoside ABC-type transport system permease subunit